ncbi:MAG: hypothetical protein K940chlam7_02135 [Chlamydiae bacterium]|nr:hypothetical protein [Chlamydiota bacterium]
MTTDFIDSHAHLTGRVILSIFKPRPTCLGRFAPSHSDGDTFDSSQKRVP